MNISDKFLQSKEFDRLVPQIQFFSRVWDIPVVEQRRVRTVHTVQKTGDSPGAVLGEDVDMPVCLWFRQCRDRAGAAGAVHRQGVEPL